MNDKWVLAPSTITDAMFDAGFDGSNHLESWQNQIAARPAIPRDVWDAMVERGARATFVRRNGSKTSWAWDSSGLDDEHPGARARYLHDAETAIRAALGNPMVEGDET